MKTTLFMFLLGSIILGGGTQSLNTTDLSSHKLNGRVKSYTEYTSAAKKDETGKMVKGACGEKTKFVFDKSGRLKKWEKYFPDEKKPYMFEHFVYDKNGRLQKKNTHNEVVHYTYNNEGLLVKEDHRRSGEVVEYTYDTNKNLVRREAISPGVRGRKRYLDGALYAIEEYAYDEYGNKIKEVFISGSAGGGITRHDSTAIAIEYTDKGTISKKEKTFFSIDRTTETEKGKLIEKYDAHEMLQETTHYSPSDTLVWQFKFNYLFDDHGNWITKIREEINGNGHELAERDMVYY